MRPRRQIVRHAIVSIAFVLIYLLLNRPEVVFFSRIGLVAWYPAIGLVMAVLVGISPWYAGLASLAVPLAGIMIYRQPVFSFSNTADAIGVAMCYGTAAYILRGPLKIDLELRRRRDVVRYVVVSATAAVGAALIGAACLVADHSIPSADYSSSTLAWFLGDAIGLIGIAPFLLIHLFPRLRKWLSPGLRSKSPASRTDRLVLTATQAAEAGGQTLTILLVLWVMFGMSGRYDNFYLSFIPIIWIAMRQGIRRVVIGLLGINFGIVVAMHFFPPTPALFLKTAFLMLVSSSVGLIVGSEVSERERLALDVNEQTAYLDSLIQNSPLGIVVLNKEGSIQLTNPAFETIFQHDREQLASLDVGHLGAVDGDQAGSSPVPEILAGNTVHKTIRHQQKRGQTLDVAVHGVPLRLGGEVRGAYLIYEDVTEQTKASRAQQEHAESQNRLVKQLELRTRQTSWLNEMGELLGCSGTVKEASSVAATCVQTLFPESRSGALYLFKSSRNLLEAVAQWGTGSISDAVFSPDACWSLRRGQPHWSRHSSHGPACQHMAVNPDAGCLCVPMMAQGNIIGVLQLEFRAVEETLPDASQGARSDHQQLAVSAASQIALSVASLQFREALREQSIRDPLTGLYNRRFLEEALERELQVAGRKKHPVSVLFLDLDHFKRFNDTFGHDAGDAVLRSVADLFRTSFRSTDICCRYGGEEFAIILPESSSEDAAIRARKLLSEVKSMRVEYKKQVLGPFTLSVGVAAFPQHCLTADALLTLADQSLYESKTRGRDLVTVAT